MIPVGEKDVEPDLRSHVPGVHDGNRPTKRGRRHGIEFGTDPSISGAPRRSTGISPKKHGTIDPRTPKLTPP